ACAAPPGGPPPRTGAAAPRGRGPASRPRLSGPAADDLIARARAVRQPGDVVVASIHWGSNWGYDVTDDQVRFAHRLIDGGVDVIHGHSSHHPRPIEVYRGRLVLYGCGDAIHDSRGHSGYQQVSGGP